MFNWLFTEEHRKKREAAKKAREEARNGYWTRDTAKPNLGSRPKPAPSNWKSRYSNKITQISTGSNSSNVVIQNNGKSYERTVRNGVETVKVDGKVLTGDEAKAAKKKYESWVDDFNDSMEDFRENMADFADDMRDMARDMRNMFK